MFFFFIDFFHIEANMLKTELLNPFRLLQEEDSGLAEYYFTNLVDNFSVMVTIRTHEASSSVEVKSKFGVYYKTEIT